MIPFKHLFWSCNTYTFPVIHIPEKITGKKLHSTFVKKFLEVNATRFAWVFLGKVSFCLISFDAQLCLKRNLEVSIVSWIVKTYFEIRYNEIYLHTMKV